MCGSRERPDLTVYSPRFTACSTCVERLWLWLFLVTSRLPGCPELPYEVAVPFEGARVPDDLSPEPAWAWARTLSQGA